VNVTAPVHVNAHVPVPEQSRRLPAGPALITIRGNHRGREILSPAWE